MKKKSLAITLLMIMGVMLISGCSAKETPKEIEPKIESEGTDEAINLGYDKLIMGLDDTFAPLGFRDEKGDLVGFDVEFAQAVSQEIGIPIEFQPIDWSMKETELTNKNIDIIWNGYTITEERKEKVLFTNPYLANRQIVVTLADSGIEKLTDLSGKTVAVQSESSAVDAINTKPEIKDTFGNMAEFETNNDCLMDLEAGRSDAVVADEVLIRYYISIKGADKYKILDEDFGNEEYGIGVRKEDTALADAINTAIHNLKVNGKGTAISEKWFGEDIIK